VNTQLRLSDTTIQQRDYLQVLARGLAVLEGFNDQNEWMTLAELSKIVELPRATVRRCLLTLKSLGYIEVNGDKFFRLAPKVLVLAKAYTSSSLLPRIAQPVIERVSETLNESCSVSVLYGDEIIYVARSTRKRRGSLLRDVGSNLPAYITSMGRVLLANLPKNELDLYLERVELNRFTSFTIQNKTKLRRIIEQAHEQEYCIIDQEFELELRAIATPIRNSSGRIVAAMSVNTEASRTTKQQLKTEYLPVLRAAANELRVFLLS
jgi:IclR family transcriptional regulator, pca regulon regulatory protein